MIKSLEWVNTHLIDFPFPQLFWCLCNMSFIIKAFFFPIDILPWLHWNKKSIKATMLSWLGALMAAHMQPSVLLAEQIHKSHNAPAPYLGMDNSERCTMGCGTCITGVVKFVSCDDAAVWPHKHSRFPWLCIVQPRQVYNVHCPVGTTLTENWPLADTQPHCTLTYVSLWGQRQSVAGLRIGSHQDQGIHRLWTGPCLNKLLGTRVSCVHIVKMIFWKTWHFSLIISNWKSVEVHFDLI